MLQRILIVKRIQINHKRMQKKCLSFLKTRSKRIVAIDSRKRRDGAEIERLGWYDPLQGNDTIKLNENRIVYWLNEGAQASETVNNILKENGLNYRLHLMNEGKSEDQDCSGDADDEHRDQDEQHRRDDDCQAHPQCDQDERCLQQ